MTRTILSNMTNILYAIKLKCLRIGIILIERHLNIAMIRNIYL